jgi:poly-gamma-glutamate synthesis protein (capsule biosynthesis protein)
MRCSLSLAETSISLIKRSIVFLLIACLMSACSEDTEGTPPPTIRPTLEQVSPATETPQEETAEPTPDPTTQSPTVEPPELPPTAEPTLEPVLVTSESFVPFDIQEAVLSATAANEVLYRQVEGEADITVAVNAGQPIANWVYVVAAPFPTVLDGITSADLIAAWNGGGLLMDAETAAVFTALWGQPDTPAETVTPIEFVATIWQRQTESETAVLGIVPFERLEPQLKVLSIDGESPVSTEFDPGSYPLTVPIGLVGEADEMALLLSQWLEPLTNRHDNLITHIGMTGPAGMRRAVADRMEKYGLTYPAEETGPVLQVVDIAHMSNENAFATDCPPPDPFDSTNVCNRDEYLELMTWMGIDINEMTGNHLNDWGTEALLHTFDLYDSVGIQTFGGGRDLASAREPLLIEHNGNRLAFVGCNPVGPPFGWAAEDYPGSLLCEDNYGFILDQISELDEAGYLVFATLQYLEDYQYEVLETQRTDFHNLAAAGATAVSGSHAHHPQGFSFYEGSFIHYGLGNLLADQMFSIPTRQTFIDIYTVYDGRLISVELWTGLIEDFARQRLMTAEEREDLLQTLFGVSDWACCGD